MKLLHSPPFKSFEYVGENPSTFEVEWQHVPDWIQFPKCIHAPENLSTGPDIASSYFWSYGLKYPLWTAKGKSTP